MEVQSITAEKFGFQYSPRGAVKKECTVYLRQLKTPFIKPIALAVW